MGISYDLHEIISARFVKPSSPTPPSLRRYKLTYYDQVFSPIYVPFAVLYPNDQISNWPGGKSIAEVLVTALSTTLSYYYPFAGRLVGNVSVDCNDEGARFIEVRIKCSMSEILRSEKSADLLCCIPPDDSMLFAQLSHFDCGGMAVTVRLPHIAADGSTCSAFLNDWAAVARDSSHVPSPQFIAWSLFPPAVDGLSLALPTHTPDIFLRKRFFFHASKIAQLKDMAVSNNSGVENPTRVEVVSALLYRCASKANPTGSFRPLLLWNLADLRQITGVVPPLPRNSVGNFAITFNLSINNEDEMALHELVPRLRNAKTRFRNSCGEKSKTNEFFSTVCEIVNDLTAANHNFDTYFCSSNCGFPFYEVDFGWGKPSRACITNVIGVESIFFLMDGRNRDGIEAYAILAEPVMSAFECDQELLAFASSNA